MTDDTSTDKADINQPAKRQKLEAETEKMPTEALTVKTTTTATATEEDTWLKYDKSKQGTSSRIGADFQASLPPFNPSSYSRPVVAECSSDDDDDDAAPTRD
ncbi:hypothetical protein ScalyP_jg685 [Parmales sp. scaly parma]|nr:hypothetical protein ScalyP_jg685 [Parmales sp. scaly parma]